MTLDEARHLAQEWSGYTVSDAGDCGDKWVFGFEECKEGLGGLVVLVNKKSGECEGLSSAEFVYSFLEGELNYKRIDLPKEDS